MRRLSHHPRALVLAASLVASTLGLPVTGAAQGSSDALATSPAVTIHRKSPALAVALGIVPGAGHLYAGEARRGLTVVGAIAAVALTSAFIAVGDCDGDVSTSSSEESCENDNVLAAGGLVILGIWGWSIVDAGLAANRTNRRRARAATSSELAELARVPVTLGLSHRPTASGESVRTLNLGVRFSVR